ncbi:MAG: hypothetical protein KC910_26885 [Candidatus Eremiobacteraeota bacterium]|nr:hypothetical protein [Candidatus Eremiobacteraeota bacterium]
MKKLSLIGLALLLVMFGCGPSGPPPGARKLAIVVDGKPGTLEGTIKANNPGAAGLSSKNFKIEVPGKLEIDAGPSEYTIIFYSMNSYWMKNYKIMLDGKELLRGRDMVVEDDKGPRITLNVNAATPTPGE